jgi:hypothetical protein
MSSEDNNSIQHPEAKRFKRKKILVDPGFQLIFVFAFTIVPVTLMTILYDYINTQIVTLLSLDIGVQMLARVTAFGHHSSKLFMIFIAITIVFNVTIGLILSHKIIGPIKRLKSFFSEIADSGYRHDLKFRDGDFFQDLPEVINHFLKKKD